MFIRSDRCVGRGYCAPSIRNGANRRTAANSSVLAMDSSAPVSPLMPKSSMLFPWDTTTSCVFGAEKEPAARRAAFESKGQS